jgi:hypothetical protein
MRSFFKLLLIFASKLRQQWEEHLNLGKQES